MNDNAQPGLFGVKHSNRDFKQRSSWGKNQFNSSFPAALSAFLQTAGYKNVYIKLGQNLTIYHDWISTTELYGENPLSDNLYYAFESQYLPYQPLVLGAFPRIDLVTMRQSEGVCLNGLEVKLTALPDNSTCELNESKYGCEIVIRPDTIVYLACSIAKHFQAESEQLRSLIGDGFDAIEDWRDGVNIYAAVTRMTEAVDRVMLVLIENQEPLVMQPVWKTEGKNPRLAEHCLDVFVWSNLAFAQLFLDVARREIVSQRTITRQVRTAIWLFKMLYDFSLKGRIDHLKIMSTLQYNLRTDKAFVANGVVMHEYMKGEILIKPRVTKKQIREIVFWPQPNSAQSGFRESVLDAIGIAAEPPF